MVLKCCHLRLKVAGVTQGRSWAPLAHPTAPHVTAVTSFQKPLWRRKKPLGLDLMHLGAFTRMSLRGNRGSFLCPRTVEATDLRMKVVGCCYRCCQCQ